MEPFLKTIDLKKSYRIGRHLEPALTGVDMDVKEGEFVAIVGPSGCGKSTLLHLLGGLHRPSSGRIFFDGAELTAFSDAHLTSLRKRHIGFVFQRFNLLPTLTASGNIEIALKIRGEDSSKGRIAETLSAVGLDGKGHHRPSELSMGEQQRVAIARAIVSRPKLLLADEPTGNLDSKNSDHVLDIFRRLNTEYRQTIVMITHNREAAETANRILHMKDGKIAL
jgi:putative ABC transport system ATP-binding protein